MNKGDTIMGCGYSTMYYPGGYSGILVTRMCEWGEIVKPQKGPSG